MLSRMCLRKIVGSFFIESALVQQVSCLLKADGWNCMLQGQLFSPGRLSICLASPRTQKDLSPLESRLEGQCRCFSCFPHEHKIRRRKNGLPLLLLGSVW